MQTICVHCGSDNTHPQKHVDHVYECLDCGEFFEDDDFLLEHIRESRERKQSKALLEYG